MKMEDDFLREQGASQEQEQSLRDRAKKSLYYRKKQLRTKIIFLNSAIALVVIMLVLVVKVVSLNQQGSEKTMKNNGTKVSGEDRTVKATPPKKQEATPVPTKTPEVTAVGTDRWLRKNLDRSKPMVALTFDDGPYTPVTRRILTSLEKNDAKATFFWVGNRLTKYEESVKQAYNLGCQIASHTYAHVTLTSLKKDKIKAQIDRTNQVLTKIIGCGTTALRPPGGNVDQKVRASVGVPMICWNVDSEDWKSRNTKKVLKRCQSIEDGDIILMHDLYPATAAAVEKLVPQLKKKGFQLVTIDELFYYKGIALKKGKVYYSGK